MDHTSDLPDHEPNECTDVTCRPCLTLQQRESVVRLELAILDAEESDPSGMFWDDTLTVGALDIRNVLDLLRAA